LTQINTDWIRGQRAIRRPTAEHFGDKSNSEVYHGTHGTHGKVRGSEIPESVGSASDPWSRQYQDGIFAPSLFLLSPSVCSVQIRGSIRFFRVPVIALTRSYCLNKTKQRRPQIGAAFRRIALCEQAGTGMRMMVSAWRQLNHPAPMYLDDRTDKPFEMRLSTTLIGNRKPKVESTVESIEDRILELLRAQPMCKSDVARALKKKRPDGQVHTGINTLLANGFIERTIPAKPNSRLQQYRLTQTALGKKAGQPR